MREPTVNELVRLTAMYPKRMCTRHEVGVVCRSGLHLSKRTR